MHFELARSRTKSEISKPFAHSLKLAVHMSQLQWLLRMHGRRKLMLRLQPVVWQPAGFGTTCTCRVAAMARLDGQPAPQARTWIVAGSEPMD